MLENQPKIQRWTTTKTTTENVAATNKGINRGSQQKRNQQGKQL